MIARRLLNSRLPAILALALASLPTALPPLHAQAPAAPAPQPAQFDPSDVYFQGYLAAREAEELEKKGDFIAAAEKYQRACKLFDAVAKFHPNWKSEIVTERNALTRASLEVVRPKADALRQKDQGVIAELEGGTRMPARPADPDPAADIIPPNPGVLEVDPLVNRRLAEAEAEAERLRKQLAAANPEDREAARNASRVDDLQRQRDALQSQLRTAEADVRALRAKLNQAPVQQELKGLNDRIQRLEQERDAMALALTKSRGEHTETLAEVATLEADLKAMQQQAEQLRQQNANLERDAKKEREIANEVVRGQQRQIQDLEKTLTLRGEQLAAANNRIASLERELVESRDAYSQLRDEHNTLLQERDQMAALLKLNEAGRIQELIEQNMGLAKQLREANEKVERFNIDNNQTKDEYTEALRDLAIAKSQINKLQQEKRAQNQRLADLEKRLRNEDKSLASGNATNSAEADMLREIIKRQLRVQERRRQARDLLVQAVKDLGNQDPRVKEAIDLMDGQEIALTPDEQKLIADREVDGEFISPYARDRETVGAATNDLNRDLESFDRAATKAFVAGRLLPTRELYQYMLESHPGHTPALCKLGVVHLRLEDLPAAADTFRRAVELDTNNPYAHRMLGFTLMRMDDLPAAEANVKRATELAPDDANAHSLLGIITYRLGRTDEAESHYRAAIAADPMPSEPYFNLAYLCASNKARHEEARLYYNQALERGAIPDPDLEKRIHQP
jgi:hypothetical protein